MFNRDVQASIPAGHGYVSGSADVEIIDSKPAGRADGDVIGEPSHGATGQTNFGVQVSIQNIRLKSEWVRFRVCFDVITPEGVAWEVEVATWRTEQADAEIEILKAKKEEEFNAFLLSDRLGAEIERLMFAEYFGVTDITDCCRFIARVRSIFDFDKLSYSLLPTWNQDGDKCQKSDPVTIYTAKCLQFYLPIKEGLESDALTLLLSIQAIPGDANILMQIWGYINEIQNMRDTLFNSMFDPDGWDKLVDQPLGYQLTPYDTDSFDKWNTAYESKCNFQLIDAHVITVPCGTRTEMRPALCGDCPDDDGNDEPDAGGNGTGDD